MRKSWVTQKWGFSGERRISVNAFAVYGASPYQLLTTLSEYMLYDLSRCFYETKKASETRERNDFCAGPGCSVPCRAGLGCMGRMELD